MNKKIILSLGAVALLASSLYAYGPQGSMKRGCNQSNGQNKMMMKQGNNYKNNGRIIKMVMMLDLSGKQVAQIKSIMQDNIKDVPNPHGAFSDAGFDKTKFIKLVNEKRDSKIERKAELISKIYEVLTPSQKKDLKTILNMKDVMKKKMINKGACGGQNCNGRR